MSIITSVYRELVMGGHILALGTASIAAASAILLGGNPTAVLLIMAYLFSYGAYMMNRNAEMEEDAVSNPVRTGYLARREKYLPAITLTCFATGYLLAALTNVIFFLALLLPLFLSLLYSVGSRRLVPLLGARKLKEKLLFKNVTISFGWSLIPLLVALYYQRAGLELLLIAPFIFLRLMLNTILFDVRDLEGDKASGGYGRSAPWQSWTFSRRHTSPAWSGSPSSRPTLSSCSSCPSTPPSTDGSPRAREP
jgi:4-hydroxybenzoate polyprenyltransferase